MHSAIVKMMKEPAAEITQDDAQRIRDFYGDFWWWHAGSWSPRYD